MTFACHSLLVGLVSALLAMPTFAESEHRIVEDVLEPVLTDMLEHEVIDRIDRRVVEEVERVGDILTDAKEDLEALRDYDREDDDEDEERDDPLDGRDGYDRDDDLDDRR